ncbi:MAG: nitrogen regulation protein NR(II) [Acidobacteriota bacterium]
MIRSTSVDITERKLAEQILSATIESSPVAVVAVSQEGKIAFVNSQAEQLFGYNREEVVGQLVEILVPERVRTKHPEYRTRFFAEPRATPVGRGRLVCARRRDGSEFLAELGLTPIETAEGPMILCSTVEATGRKQLEEELARCERLGALGEMAAGVAHNFNNLLAGILGRAELSLLRLGGESEFGEVERNLAVIKEAALNGAAIVRRLMQFAGGTARSAEAAPVDVKELLAQTVDLSRHRWKDEAEAQGRHIQVALELRPVPLAVGNPAELQEVLLCLILNATDAMPRGGTLTLSSWAEDGRVCLGVKDTGIGIPEEIRAHIFEPFFTTKGPHATGLGLSVCCGIIRRHEGEIVVDSKPGRGTTFTIKLPAWAASALREDKAEGGKGGTVRRGGGDCRRQNRNR